MTHKPENTNRANDVLNTAHIMSYNGPYKNAVGCQLNEIRLRVRAIRVGYAVIKSSLVAIEKKIAAGMGGGLIVSDAMCLFDYINSHISHENVLMRRISYPDLSAHESEHEWIETEIECKRHRLHSDEILDTTHFIRSWFASHDDKYDSHLEVSAQRYLRECVH